MIRHKQAALSVLEGIRSNPNMTAGQGAAIVEAVFPGKGATYLGWYGEWWYKFGVTDAATWAALKTRVSGMSSDHFQVAKTFMSRLIGEMAVIRLRKIAKQAEVSLIEDQVASYRPAEEVTAQILEHWNSTGPKAREYDSLLAMKAMLETEIEEIED